MLCILLLIRNHYYGKAIEPTAIKWPVFKQILRTVFQTRGLLTHYGWLQMPANANVIVHISVIACVNVCT